MYWPAAVLVVWNRCALCGCYHHSRAQGARCPVLTRSALPSASVSAEGRNGKDAGVSARHGCVCACVRVCGSACVYAGVCV